MVSAICNYYDLQIVIVSHGDRKNESKQNTIGIDGCICNKHHVIRSTGI